MAITIGSQTSTYPATVPSAWEVEDDITSVDENVPNRNRAEIQAIATMLGVQSAKTAAYTTVVTDGIILCDATSAAFTVTLLAAATALANKRYTIIKTDSSANAVTIDGNGAETIDGAATRTLASQYAAITIFTNGTTWYSDRPDTGETPSTQAFGDEAAQGTSLKLTRADHKHAMPAAPGLQSVQVFTSSGTWTKPTGITKVIAEVVGGGGGSGGCNTAGRVAAGGGGGGYGRELIDVSAISSVTVTIGAGGAGGGVGADGTSGGTSSFGAYLSCTGGTAGQNESGGTGGAGGTASGGDINLPGGSGFRGAVRSEGSTGNGGASGGGMGAGTQTVWASNGSAGNNYGGGASGGHDLNTTGAAGAAGIVIVWEFK